MKEEKTSYQKGLWAETIACLLLFFKGYRILERRYKTPVGEIDIIASRSGTLVFIEVKARATKTEALEAITPRNRGRVFRAAQFFLSHNTKASGLSVRFDAMIVTKSFQISHLINAWQENDCDFKRVS